MTGGSAPAPVAICPTCGLAPAPAEELATVCGIAARAIERVQATPSRLSHRQRVDVKLALATMLGLQVLYLEEAGRRRDVE